MIHFGLHSKGGHGGTAPTSDFTHPIIVGEDPCVLPKMIDLVDIRYNIQITKGEG